MASTLDSRDLFKDSRQNRLSSLDNVSSLTFGSSFGVGKSMWNNTSSIWRATNNYLDGPADEEPQILGQTVNLTPSKIGSKSLLLSSESEAPPSRKNVPWAMSVNTTAFAARSQNQPISPLRSRPDGSLSASQRTSQNGPLMPSAASAIHGEFQPFPASSLQSTNGARHLMDMSALAEQLPTMNDSHLVSIQDPNLASFQANGSFNRISASRAFQDDSNEKRANLYQRQTSIFNGAFNDPSRIEPFRPSHPTCEYEQYSPGYKASMFTSANKAQFDINDPATHFAGATGDRVYETRPSYHADTASAMGSQGHKISDGKGSALSFAHSDSLQNFVHHPLVSYSRNNSFGDPSNASPTANEYRRSLNGSFYSNSATPPSGSESIRTTSNISTRASHRQVPFDQAYKDSGSARDFSSIQPNPLQSSFMYPPPQELAGYPGVMRMNPLASPYTMSGYLSMPGLPSAPRFQSRQAEHPQVIRSSLLEEFRMNNKNNKRYELRDIYNHVVEFSGDQHGSRFIQQKLETANSDEKDQIFTEIQPNSLQLMTDVFGNYVIQKLFEHGNQSQKKLLANQMKGHVLSLSTQMYGCRVVQKALEHVLTDQQARIVKELENHVLKCVKDQNGNHVIQKAIERVPADHIQFIISAFTDQVQRLATHPYGCRVIQRMLEHCQEPAKKSILQELHSCVPRLITDQFGNYVIQHVIENGEAEDRHSIVVIVLAQLLVFSKHKFASNVVEKSIEFAQEDQRSEILRRLTGPDESGESPVLGLMRDQYGNYVIQKILGQLVGQEREALVNQIKSQLVQLKRFSYGKQIIAIEKLIFDDPPSHSLSTSSQSSTLPSTNASTVEGPINSPYHDASMPRDTQIAVSLMMGSNRT